MHRPWALFRETTVCVVLQTIPSHSAAFSSELNTVECEDLACESTVCGHCLVKKTHTRLSRPWVWYCYVHVIIVSTYHNTQINYIVAGCTGLTCTSLKKTLLVATPSPLPPTSWQREVPSTWPYNIATTHQHTGWQQRLVNEPYTLLMFCHDMNSIFSFTFLALSYKYTHVVSQDWF